MWRPPGATVRGAGKDVPCRALRSVNSDRQPGLGQGQPHRTSGCPGGTLTSSLQCAGLQLGGRVLGGGAVPGPRWPVAGRGRSQGESQHLQEALDGRSGVTASAPSFKDGHLAWEAEVAASVPSLGTESRVGESLSEPDRSLRGLVVLRSPGREKAKWWVPTPWWRGHFLPSRQLRGRVTWGPGPGGIGT